MSEGLKRLHELDLQIAESRARIVQQKQYIAELMRNDCNAAASKALLSEAGACRGSSSRVRCASPTATKWRLLLLPGDANASAAGTPRPPTTLFRRPLSLPALSGTGIFAIYRVRRRRS
jgi:hypothetical protein